MKKLMSLLLVLAFAFTCAAQAASGDGALLQIKNVELKPIPEIPQGVTIYVSPDGAENGDGSRENPFGSLSEALEAAGESLAANHVVIDMAAGEYAVSEPIVLDETLLNGANGYTLTFLGNGNATISGGRRIAGWEATEEKNVWKTELAGLDVVNGLYVDGVSQTLCNQQVYGGFSTARGRNGIVNAYGETFNNWQNYSTLVPMQSVTFTTRDIYELEMDELIADPDVFFVMTQTFKIIRFEIGRITNNDDFNFSIEFSQDSLNLIDYAHMADYDTSEDRFYLYNSRQLLDKEGEYYFDRATSTLYFYTKEDPNGKDCVVPVSEGLVRIEGTQKKLASGVRFDGVAFRYSTEGIFMTHPMVEDQSDSCAYAYKPEFDGEQEKKGTRYLLPGQVYLNYASNVIFTACDFMCMESAALQMQTYVYNVIVDSCRFDQIAGSAIECGSIDFNTGFGVKDINPVPDDPENVYKVGKKTNFTPALIRVSNNEISNCGSKFVGSNGVLAYYANRMDIVNNSISNTAGCAISVGWGWGNLSKGSNQGNKGCGDINIIGNAIKAASMRVADSGGIYTLGFFMGNGCYIGSNYIDMKGSHDSGIPAIYLDEGSEFVYVTNNFSVNSRMWLSERALPVNFNGSVYEAGALSHRSMMNCVIDGNYTYKASGKHFVYASYEWPSAAAVTGSNFIVTPEIVVKNWKEDATIGTIIENAGCKGTVGTEARR